MPVYWIDTISIRSKNDRLHIFLGNLTELILFNTNVIDLLKMREHIGV